VVWIIACYVIYHCYGGSHSSVAAAAIHVGLLARDKKPGRRELTELPYFDSQKAQDHGFLQFMGRGKEGALVYSVGFETASAPVINAAKNLFSLGREAAENVIYVGTRPQINNWMIAGGIISRLLGLTCLGRPLVAWGTQLAHRGLVGLVEKTEARVRDLSAGEAP